uniref:NADH-ubiquinone oxidoreductase chain 3 n=1 Tax=Ecnomus latus TaxID=623472 RepID=A0A9E8RSL3_9NEOP|nr:NADH dehydrogenase subunit 3 [Ecnomus latus]UZZ43902.1 NADH dehydrogenase subunit 3 [Ecnomus latus]
MIMLINCLFMLMTIVVLLIGLSMMISNKKLISHNKLSPFECGFNPINMKRIPFSMHFFMITILFLIFDVEITIILPFMMVFKLNNIFIINLMFNMFLLILMLGLMHEWNQNILNWKK